MIKFYNLRYQAVNMDKLDCHKKCCACFSATRHGQDVQLSLSHKNGFHEKKHVQVAQIRSSRAAISRHIVWAKKVSL